MPRDAIDDFMSMPQETQLTTLQALPADQQDKLLAEVKLRNAPLNTRLTTPNSPMYAAAHPVLSAIQDFGKGALATGEQVVTHPIDSAKGTLSTLNDVYNADPGTANPTPETLAARGRLGQQWEQAKEHPAFTAGGLAGGLAVGKAADVAVKTPQIIPKAFRAGVESFTGTSPRNVADLVDKTKEVNADAAKQATVQTAEQATQHLQQTQDALHETAGRELQHQQAVKAAQDTADAANKALDDQHHAAVRDALDQTRENEDLYQNELRKAKSESESAYQDKLKEVEGKRAKAEQDHKDELRQYFDKKAAVEQQRSAAIEGYKKAVAQQGKIAPTADALRGSSEELRGRVETSRENALKVGNEKYNGVNEALNPLPADTTAIGTAVNESLGKIKGTDTQPAILKSIASHLEPDYVYQGGQKFGPGTKVYESVKASEGGVPTESKALTYKDLQGYYSELGSELSKGTLPGDVYTAYDTIHEAIGNEMQRIADSKGKGAHLNDARNYWRLMKQTFGKPVSLADNATAAIKGANPEFLTDDAQANRVRMLGSFDPEIPKLVKRIGGLQKGLSELPDETSPRVLLGKATEKATAKPIPAPPQKPSPIPNPPPIPPREVALPPRVPVPDRPTPIQAKLPAPPERIAPPDRPSPVVPDVKTIGPEDIQAAKAQGMKSRTQMIRRRGEWIATGAAGYGMLNDIMRDDYTKIPRAIVQGAVAVGTVMGVAKLLEDPEFVQAITKATPRDIAKIPPELRRNLGPVVQAAKAKGIPVSPSFAALAGATVQHPTLSQKSPVQPSTKIVHEDADAQVPPPLQDVSDSLGVKYQQKPGFTADNGENAIASVEPNNPNTININDPQRFNQGPVQTKAHELYHLWRNNLPGPIRAKALPDNATDPYNISDLASLRSKGYTMATIPNEQGARIVQMWAARPEMRKQLQPWIDDMASTGMSVMQGTDPNQQGINTTPRTPLPPAHAFQSSPVR